MVYIAVLETVSLGFESLQVYKRIVMQTVSEQTANLYCEGSSPLLSSKSFLFILFKLVKNLYKGYSVIAVESVKVFVYTYISFLAKL